MNTPERHGIHIHTARTIASPMLLTIKDKAAAEPSSIEWQAMGQQLLCGDPLADDVAAWLARGEGQWSDIERALHSDADGVTSLAAPIQAFMQHVRQRPAWLDEHSLIRGCDVVARSGKTGMRILRDFGLMAGYQASAINQTLLKTGALEKGAQRRVAETTKWWMDATEPGAILPGGTGFVTTLRVRLIHAMVRRQLAAHKDWDHKYLGLPVNQLDMQVTYLAFSVMFLLGQRVLGVPVSKQEGADVMHLWRYIGWLMGLDELLLVDSEQGGRIALYRNLLSQAQADEGSKQLAQALMDEPLERYYPNAQWFRSHWDKEVHLSILRLFVGSQGMRRLGLPPCRWPWYPFIFAPVNALTHLTLRLLPGGRAFLTRRGRRAQQRMLKILFGDYKPQIRQVT